MTFRIWVVPRAPRPKSSLPDLIGPAAPFFSPPPPSLPEQQAQTAQVPATAEPERDPMLGEPPAKRRDIDPIAPTKHPWNLPAGIDLPHCDPGAVRNLTSLRSKLNAVLFYLIRGTETKSMQSEESYVVIPREANLPIDAEIRRIVARVSQAVVAVASIEGNFMGLHVILICVFLVHSLG